MEAWKALGDLEQGFDFWLSLEELPELDLVDKDIGDTSKELHGRKRIQKVGNAIFVETCLRLWTYNKV